MSDAYRSQLPGSLVDAVQSGACIPFVGSGLSIEAGLPTWTQILDQLADACERERCPNSELVRTLAEEGEYLEAAERAKTKLGPQLFLRVLDQCLGKPSTELQQTSILQEFAWRIAAPLVITTNYDTILEDVARATGTPAQVVTPLHTSRQASLLQPNPQARRILFKLHGSIDLPESVVFTRSDYERLYTEQLSSVSVTLLSRLVERTFLFVGFGMQDPAVLGHLQRASVVFDGFSGSHFALVPRGEQRSEALWASLGVHALEYTDAADLKGLLGAIAECSVEKPADSESARSQAMKLRQRPETLSLAAADAIPADALNVRQRSFGECVLVATPREEDGRLTSWSNEDIRFAFEPTFFVPPDPLAQVQRRMDSRFYDLDNFPTPRVNLISFLTEPRSSGRFGGLTIRGCLTDWALVHGVQQCITEEASEFSPETAFRFWRSVQAIEASGTALSFCHHLAVHGLIVSSDDYVVVCKRVNVSNQRGRLSVSFEEQMQAGMILPNVSSSGPRWRRIDGDLTPGATFSRGVREELGIDISPAAVRFLGLAFESTSIAANLIAIAHSRLSIDEIYRSWERAEDRGENLMAPPDKSPKWDPHSMGAMFLSSRFRDDELLGGPWHASSPMRVILGLMHEFGIDELRGLVADEDFERLERIFH